MNLSGIEYVTHVVNPLEWGCMNDCKTPDGKSYCYGAALCKRFRPDLDFLKPVMPLLQEDPRVMGPMPYERWKRWRSELDAPLLHKKPARILVQSMGDLFGDWVSDDHIRAVLDMCVRAHWHTFLLLTKNPSRLPNFTPYPRNCWVGASVDYARRFKPSVEALAQVDCGVRWISFEPLLEDMHLRRRAFGHDANQWPIKWFVVGALTGPYGRKWRPKPEWVRDIIGAAGRDTAVFLKDNLIPVCGEKMVMAYREFPKERE